MHIAAVLYYKYPESDPLRDWQVQDDSDGKGEYIAVWNLPDSQPTKAQLQAIWDSSEFRAWNKARQTEVIDIRTAQAIRKSIHPHVSIDEELGILRDQLAFVLARQGIDPTEKFQNLQIIVKAEIAKGRRKKDALEG